MATELKLLLHMNTSLHLGSLGTTYSEAIPDWSLISEISTRRAYFIPMRYSILIGQVYRVDAT